MVTWAWTNLPKPPEMVEPTLNFSSSLSVSLGLAAELVAFRALLVSLLFTRGLHLGGERLLHPFSRRVSRSQRFGSQDVLDVRDLPCLVANDLVAGHEQVAHPVRAQQSHCRRHGGHVRRNQSKPSAGAAGSVVVPTRTVPGTAATASSAPSSTAASRAEADSRSTSVRTASRDGSSAWDSSTAARTRRAAPAHRAAHSAPGTAARGPPRASSSPSAPGRSTVLSRRQRTIAAPAWRPRCRPKRSCSAWMSPAATGGRRVRFALAALHVVPRQQGRRSSPRALAPGALPDLGQGDGLGPGWKHGDGTPAVRPPASTRPRPPGRSVPGVPTRQSRHPPSFPPRPPARLPSNSPAFMLPEADYAGVLRQVESLQRVAGRRVRRNGLQQLGRLRLPHFHGGTDPGQRPPPGHPHAVDLVSECPAL